MSEHTKEVIRKPTTPKPAMVDSEGSTHDTEEKALDLERTETTNFPDGGFRAWTVAFGASSAFLCTLGFTNSFGIFQTYYMENQLQHDGASKVSWIGGLQAWVIFATGLIGGPLFDRYGAWVSHDVFSIQRNSTQWLTYNTDSTPWSPFIHSWHHANEHLYTILAFYACTRPFDWYRKQFDHVSSVCSRPSVV